ncbi:MAG TPA: PadR family transcriptional regulator, partial [Acidimicrobiales bacterium]
MLDLAILGLLHEQELHGYEIRRRLRDDLGLFANISFGSLYPALSRLEAAHAVTVAESGGATTTAPTMPFTGSLSGERAGLRARRAPAPRGTKRSRKVYRITDQGRQLFEQLLDADEPAGADDARS